MRVRKIFFPRVFNVCSLLQHLCFAEHCQNFRDPFEVYDVQA
jgi:hypothetical protein